MAERLKFVIVGHVDHGKSTLIGRLLYDTDSIPGEKLAEVQRACEDLGREMEFGFLVDHLEEERSQGITIDTAQTFFSSGRRRYVIIDAPGHKEFIRNMVTGASQAEAALLMVDVHEGAREQTRRHAYVLRMLGLDQVIVAVNKMDLVGYSEDRFCEVQREVIAHLSSLGISPRFSIPVSAREGDNVAIPSERMPWYAGPTVLDGLDSLVPGSRDLDLPLRLPVQDVYKVRDKRVLVGRVEAGRIRAGQPILFLPERKQTTVGSIEALWADKPEATAGESIGITTIDPLFVERGAVACPVSDEPFVTSRFRASLFWLSSRPFDPGEKLSLRIATQDVPAVVTIQGKVDSSTLAPIVSDPDRLLENEVAQVLIDTRRPVVIEDFNHIRELGRFVLVREFDAVAGGIVTSTSAA